MRDEKLPNSGKFIINLDSKDNYGSHWCAVDLDNSIYFDPFGFPPPIEVIKKGVKYYSDSQVQHLDEKSCGQYSCHVLRYLGENNEENRKMIDNLYH